jgi:hypothetical protein
LSTGAGRALPQLAALPHGQLYARSISCDVG